MSWAYTAGSVVSTTDDLNRFYRALLGGKLVRRGVPRRDDAHGPRLRMDYGHGI
ncbi:hypothetical protein GCM10023238_34990 [Streptomyces heliomycini]